MTDCEETIVTICTVGYLALIIVAVTLRWEATWVIGVIPVVIVWALLVYLFVLDKVRMFKSLLTTKD